MKCPAVALAFLLSAFAVAAQTNVPSALETNVLEGSTVREMSLQDCLQEALAHNLDIQIQRYSPQISLYDLKANYSGYDPLLTGSGTHSHSLSGGGLGPSLTNSIPPSTTVADSFRSGLAGGTPWGMSYSLSGNISDTYGSAGGPPTPFERSGGAVSATVVQPLLRNFWIDNTRLGIRLGRLSVSRSEQDWRNQIITTVTAVANAYHEVIFAREDLKVKKEALALAQTQLDQDKQRSQIGTIAELDVQQDEAQVAQAKSDLIQAAAALDGDEDTLKNLISDDYRSWHNVYIEPTETLNATMVALDLQDSWDKGMSQRPDLLQARLDAQTAGIQLKYYRNQIFPEVDLVGTYGYNGTGREYSDVFGQIDARDRPFYSYGGQISIPLGNFGARNRFKAGKANLKTVLLTLKKKEQAALVSIDDAVKTVDTKYQSVQATRQARIYAEAALDAEQKKYEVGKSTTFTVLQLQSKLTSARSGEIRALADYNEALAKLAQEEGTTLERNRISLDLMPAPGGGVSMAAATSTP